MSATEENHMHNMEEYARGSYEIQKDALQKNLIIMHRTMLIAFFGVVISLGLLATAIFIRPQPKIIVTPIYSQRK